MYRFAKTSFLGFCVFVFVFVCGLVGAGCGLDVSGAKSESAGAGPVGANAGGGGAGGAGGVNEAAGGAGGVFVPPEGCGNGTIAAGEACDDGNNNDGDTCTKDCQCGVPDPNTDALAFRGKALLRCYVLFGEERDFSGSRGDCENRGMLLASITSQSELADVTPYVNKSTWIGGYKESGAWKWVSGEPWNIRPCDAASVADCDNSIDLWMPGEPNSSSSENKIAFWDDNDAFNNEDFYASLPYLCEAP